MSGCIWAPSCLSRGSTVIVSFNQYWPSNSKTGASLLIDCFKTIEYFRFWLQNHCLFFFRFFFRCFFDSFSQKNLKLIAFRLFAIRAHSGEPDCLVSTETLTYFRNRQPRPDPRPSHSHTPSDDSVIELCFPQNFATEKKSIWLVMA